MYDLTILGAGISGIFLAYAYIKTNPDRKVLLIEKGKKLTKRACPIELGQVESCVDCALCHRSQGFGGMGRSEGKYNYTNDFGGHLGQLVGMEKALSLMKEVDDILCSLGADTITTYDTTNAHLQVLAKDVGCQILTTKVRHLGTKMSLKVLEAFYEKLNDKVTICFETEASHIEKEQGVFKISLKGKNSINSRRLVVATGISGGKTFLNYCNQMNLQPRRVRLDLGIRVEMLGDQLDPILKESFETKIKHRWKDKEATTYCMNPQGKIIKKYQEGLVMADGQNFRETQSASPNLNFTVFVPRYFSTSMEAKEYAREIIGGINELEDEIAVQRLEDLLAGKSTTKEKMKVNKVKASLRATPINLQEVVPKDYLEGALHIIDAFEKLCDNRVDRDTLLYGLDAKFYEPEVEVNEFFETKVKGLYVIGDCSGVTYSLSQAAASGLHLAHHIGGLPIENNL